MLSIIYSVGAILLAFSIYAVLRKLFGEHIALDDQNVSMATIARLGTLHALIIALIFAAEMQNYLAVHKHIVNEAAAVADVYYGIENYFVNDDKTAASSSQKAIVHYIRAVIDQEWPSLAVEKRLDKYAWKLYTEIGKDLLLLAPRNDYQRTIKNQLLKDWDAISQYRRAREAAALRDVPNFFWILAVTGFIAVIVPYYVFSPRPAHLLVIGVFAAFNGLVFAFILEMSQPFSGIGIIEADIFERLFTGDSMLPPKEN